MTQHDFRFLFMFQAKLNVMKMGNPCIAHSCRSRHSLISGGRCPAYAVYKA